VSDAAELVPHDTRVVAAVEQVGSVHSNAITSIVDPRYLRQTKTDLYASGKPKACGFAFIVAHCRIAVPVLYPMEFRWENM